MCSRALPRTPPLPRGLGAYGTCAVCLHEHSLYAQHTGPNMLCSKANTIHFAIQVYSIYTRLQCFRLRENASPIRLLLSTRGIDDEALPGPFALAGAALACMSVAAALAVRVRRDLCARRRIIAESPPPSPPPTIQLPVHVPTIQAVPPPAKRAHVRPYRTGERFIKI